MTAPSDGLTLPAGLDPGVAERARELAQTHAGDAARRELELGMLFDAHALPELAAAAYARATAAGDDPRAPYHLGRMRRQLGDAEGAVAAWRDAVARAPRSAEAHARLAEGLLDLGLVDEAREAYAAAAGLDPRQPAGAEGLARLALEDGAPQEAVDLLTASLQRTPGRRQSHYLLGRALAQLGREAAAAEQLALAEGAVPEWPDPWRDEVQGRRTGYRQVMDRAVAAGQAGAAAQVLPELRALQRAHPDDVAALEKLVAACLQTGQLDEARAVLDAFDGRRPGHARAAYLRALVDEAGGRLGPALAAADAALAAQPGWVPAHELRARLRWKSGDIRGAAAELEQALHHGGELLDDLLKLGRARAILGEPEAALAVYRRATDAHPRSVDAWVGRAELELGVGDATAAAASLRAGLELAPDDARLRKLQGLLAAAGGAGG